MSFEDFAITITLIFIINALSNAAKNFYTKKKQSRYYAIYQNEQLVDYLPLYKAQAYADELEYEFRKSTGTDHKKRMIHITLDQ